MPSIRRILFALLVLIAAAAPGARGQDIVELARRRHNEPDSTLMNYRSRLNTLVSAAFSSDPLAPPRLLVASELASSVTWQRPVAITAEPPVGWMARLESVTFSLPLQMIGLPAGSVAPRAFDLARPPAGVAGVVAGR